MEVSFKKDEKRLKISHRIPTKLYICPEIQNDVIEAIASLIRKSILAKLHSSDTGLFILKCDEIDLRKKFAKPGSHHTIKGLM